MKIRILILFLIFNFFKVKSQANDSIYVKEIKKFFKVLDFQIEDSQIFNVVVSFNNEELKYGKWKFYHDNGNIKSEEFLDMKKKELENGNTGIKMGKQELI
ncbi:hypothetical protein [Aquimarina spinulae]|uniref:hypothetical protein n=1 Tax=Aquimarina spinulae TaxID=1192023 RepID=UPI000D54B4F7|nr:hypothetical protein [Aquimarina spinulae]